MDGWNYDVTVRTPTGKEVRLSHATPSVEGVVTAMANGKLSVTLEGSELQLIRPGIDAAR